MAESSMANEDSQAYVARIQQLLHELYQNPAPEAKSAAQSELLTVQQAPDGWNIVWPLLDSESTEVQYYGASLLYQKITHFWSQLSPEHHEQLRLRIFPALVKFTLGPKIVRTRLCLALAVFVLHTVPQEWPNSISSIIQTLSSASHTGLLLEILTVLPEEFESNPVAQAPARRGAIKRELSVGVPAVLDLLSRSLCSGGGDPQVQLMAIGCFTSWTQFGLPLPEMVGIVGFLLNSLGEESLRSASSNALVEVATHPDSERYTGHLRQILTWLIQQRSLIRDKLSDGCQDTAISLCKVVVEFASANRTFLTNVATSTEGSIEDIQLEENPTEGEDPQSDALDMVQLVLEFTSQPGVFLIDEECSEITLRFWIDFLETVECLDHPCRKSTVEFYDSVLTGLIEALAYKVMFPSDEEYEKLSEDDHSTYQAYREDISDIAILLQGFVHVQFLDYLSKSLQSCLANPSPPWQQVEAVIFLLQSASQSLCSQSFSHMQSILGQIPLFPLHRMLSTSLFTLLGSLGAWLNQNPSVLSHVLPMVLGALRDQQLATTAAIAFRDICDFCCSHLVPLSRDLVSVYEGVVGSLGTAESLRVVAALGKVLSLHQPADLQQLLHPLTCELTQHLKALTAAELNDKHKQDVDKHVQIAGAFCTHVNPSLKGQQHPLLPFVTELWPSLKIVLVQWAKDEDIVNSTCICLVRIIRSFDSQFSPFLEDTIQVLGQYLTAVHHCRVVDVATQMVVSFGSDASQVAVVATLVHRMHGLCMDLFSDGTLKEHPDTLQSFLTLFTRVLSLCPQHLFSKEGAALSICELAAVALNAAETPTVNAASLLLVSYIVRTAAHPLLAEVVMRLGKQLTQQLLQGIGGGCPSSHVEYFTDVILAFTKHFKEPLSVWLQETLSREGFPTSKVTSLEKRSFIQSVLREESQKTTLRSRIKQFSFNCKGYHGIVT